MSSDCVIVDFLVYVTELMALDTLLAGSFMETLVNRKRMKVGFLVRCKKVLSDLIAVT